MSTQEELSSELESLLNRHCCENGSNTPDFILAKFMLGCLKAFEEASNEREEWYGHKSIVGGITGEGISKNNDQAWDTIPLAPLG